MMSAMTKAEIATRSYRPFAGNRACFLLKEIGFEINRRERGSVHFLAGGCEKKAIIPASVFFLKRHIGGYGLN